MTIEERLNKLEESIALGKSREEVEEKYRLYSEEYYKKDQSIFDKMNHRYIKEKYENYVLGILSKS